MAIQPVPAAPAALPFPGLNEKAAGTYNATAFAWGNQMPGYADGIKALGDNTFNNATEAKNSADLSAAKAVDSAAARDVALLAAQTAVNAPGSMATSTTSLAVNSGDKVFVLVEVGKDFAVGQFIVASSLANPLTNYFKGRVKAYDKPSKTLTMGDVAASGSGTYADWSIAVGVGPNSVLRVAYDDRATLRAMTPAAPASIIVGSLGLFSFVSGSTEPDDDETCFAATGGRWLLEAAHIDVVNGWFLPHLALINGNILYGSFTTPVATISATQQVIAGTLRVLGITVGDVVVITPPAMPTGSTYPTTSAVVTALDTITVYHTNHSASTLNVAQGIYRIAVFKENF